MRPDGRARVGGGLYNDLWMRRCGTDATREHLVSRRYLVACAVFVRSLNRLHIVAGLSESASVRSGGAAVLSWSL